MDTESSAQSPFQKLNFVTAAKNYSKLDRQSFLLLSNFAWFLYFVPIIFSAIVSMKLLKIVTKLKPSQMFQILLRCILFLSFQIIWEL